MKKVIFTILLIGTFFLANAQEGKSYEYVSITMSIQFSTIYINETGKEQEKVFYKECKKGNFNWTPVLEKVQEYEVNGWELYQNNVIGESAQINYFLLRKVRN